MPYKDTLFHFFMPPKSVLKTEYFPNNYLHQMVNILRRPRQYTACRFWGLNQETFFQKLLIEALFFNLLLLIIHTCTNILPINFKFD